MARTTYTQVYRPDGRWYATFLLREDAEKWVKKQQDSDKWTITDRRPTDEELGRDSS